jgi:hypothetical protein
MVVYYVPEQSRSSSGSQQSIVAQGEPVREGQKLMRIPNLSKMVVNVRVHEAMVGKLTGKGEQTRPTYYTDTLRATFTLGRHDIFGLVSYYGAMEELRDEMKDLDHTVTFPGLKARIKIDAKPGKIFNGHVKSVAAVAAQSEFFSSDIKVYQTMVAIDDLDLEDELRPGMSAEVTITADETSEPVLIVPIQAVLGNLAMGEKRKCYVLDANNYPHLRDIVVGKSSDKFAEIKEGLQQGDRVALNTTPLTPERSGLKPGTPSTRRGAEAEDGEGKKGGKKKDGKGAGKGGSFQPKGGAEKAFQRPNDDFAPDLYPDRKK